MRRFAFSPEWWIGIMAVLGSLAGTALAAILGDSAPIGAGAGTALGAGVGTAIFATQRDRSD